MADRTTNKPAWVVALALSGGCATELQEQPGTSSSGAGGADAGSSGSAGSSAGSAGKGGGGSGGMVGQSGSNAETAGTSGSAPEGGSGGAGAGAGGSSAGGGTGGKAGAGGGGGIGGSNAGAAGKAGMAGTGGVVGPNPCATGKLTITGGAASSTELPEFAAAMAWDGDGVTRWASAVGEPNWLYVDLGEVAHVSRVRLSWENAYATAYRIERANSSDGPWTVMQSVTNGNGVMDDLTTLTAGDGRYIRMFGVTRFTEYGFSLYELEVFGDLDESCQ